MSLEEEIGKLTIQVNQLAAAIQAQVAAQPNADRRYIMKSLHPQWNPEVHYLVDGNRVRVLSNEEGGYLHGELGLRIVQTSEEAACRALYWEAIAIQGFVYADTNPR